MGRNHICRAFRLTITAVALALGATLVIAKPAFAGITISDPFPSPPPDPKDPKDPDEICVWLKNDGADDERIKVSLYDVGVGGAMPSAKAPHTPEGPTQDVTVPAKQEIRRGTAMVETTGSLRVCWKVKPVPGRTYWVVGGNKLDQGGDVPVSEGQYSSFTYTPKERSESPGR
jgi:hypothetical protein